MRAIARIATKLDIDLHVLHVAGDRLVENGVDGLSRPDGKLGDAVLTADWPRALAPARPTQSLVTLISDVFGARGLVTTPLRPGRLAGRRELLVPSPWAVIMELPEVTEIFARLNYTRHPCMHGASSGLGLISLDLAGVCLYVQL